MDRHEFFERNLLALSPHNPNLCSRLSGAETTLDRYRFPESRSGEIVPALVDHSGTAHPLHSMIEPQREAERLVSTLKDEGFLVFLGLGGGFAPEAALNRAEVSHVLIIDYDINSIAELFCSREYIKIIGDPRCSLLIDPAPELIEACILEQYQPALCGGIRTFPLRVRAELDIPRFNAAAAAIQRGIEKVSSDYSVQAHFGSRWFSNIIRNIKAAEAQNSSAPPIREAAICAAGPSLDQQIPLLAELKQQSKSEQKVFIISADTALPALLHQGLEPDAVVSIDCQHISYYHFLGLDCRKIPLFLDIASPPLLSALSASPFFFTGGHPLAQYISRHWRPLPCIDTSGGNVTYACLSLAENLGAQRIRVYGADFSYPRGHVYAKGTYIFPFFEKKQNRFSPMAALFSTFLFRTPFLPPEENQAEQEVSEQRYYETTALRFYRRSFEEKASRIDAEIIPIPGMGAPVHIERKSHTGHARQLRIFAAGRAQMGSDEFLEQYRQAIAALPIPGIDSGAYIQRLNTEQRQVFTTLLPLAAALKKRQSGLTTGELIEEVKHHCIHEIDRVLGQDMPDRY
ncbi:MAG: DUF115 domain-containing protein [Treponema sp.]|nr:DUF115 domain-containing protein [Treponema sp.]